MQTSRRELFTTIRSEGAILPVDLLQRVAAGDDYLAGLKPADYHLSGERLNEAINRSWNRLLGAWTSFQAARSRLSESDPGIGLTRDRWLMPLFVELEYGRLQPARAVEIEGREYAISHWWSDVPIHLLGCNVPLDRRTPGVAGAARMSPHSMLQELLNRTDDTLWGFLSNGLQLRIQRDNASLTRQAYVEFDLEAMMDGEIYADFVLLWLLCHQSRVEAERPADYWLEHWSKEAWNQGTRALDGLRGGVKDAITHLGKGFLAHPANRELREKLYRGELDRQDYYRQLLRTVYRLLFLFVAEDRDLLLKPGTSDDIRQRYARYYSTRRLRNLAERRRGTRHIDLWRGLSLLFRGLGQEDGVPELGLPALGSFLWGSDSTPDLEGCEMTNADLLTVIRDLAFIQDGRVRRAVDYRNLGSEELGSVYESLLELHPVLNLDTREFALEDASGSERKTTGSYYTPSSLINSLLDTALDPVLDEASRSSDPKSAILDLKVCDPASGSGHFLIAAAHRIARRLASVRTDEEEPSVEATRAALRDVIGHCIYGVDINPMAVELCKVSLWMEALEPGKPLSFLDHRIQTGNSLLGATPALMANGIPDDAFKPIEGDDKKYVNEWRKNNREQRKGQLGFDEQMLSAPWERLGNLPQALQALDAMSEDTVADQRQKEQRWQELVSSATYENARLLADAWCAAFVWKKTKDYAYPITFNVFRDIERNPKGIAIWMREEIQRLALQFQFFHWQLAFPDVFRSPGPDELAENDLSGWSGGFDVVLGNPPWERLKLQEKEFFAARDPEIANAPNAAARGRMIKALIESEPELHTAFEEAKRVAEGASHLVRNSERFPLTGKGDVNTYSIFAETNRALLNRNGRVGCIVPSGIATDDTTKEFFQDLIDWGSLVSLYDFENRQKIFPAVDSRMKFCLLTMAGIDRPPERGAEFAFFAHHVDDLRDDERRFTLTAEDIRLLNPNTRTCPIFRSNRDAEITKAIYRRVPVLVDENRGEAGNPWGVSFLRMFDMSNDSGLFRTRDELEAQGYQLDGNIFIRDEGERFLPLYEAKMIHQYDHRWATYGVKWRESRPVISSNGFISLTPEEYDDPLEVIMTRYWVGEFEVSRRLGQRWNVGWIFGFRRVARTTDERTLISAIFPKAGAGDSIFLMNFDDSLSPLFIAPNMTSFVLDFVARQKIGGVNASFYLIEQLPFQLPTSLRRSAEWLQDDDVLLDWIFPRVLELTYTAWDMQPFARDCGYDGPPFRWDEERRFLLRCELDAAFFHLYGIERDDVDYIMETFPIVKRKDIAAHGEYRTKRVILEIYDAMHHAIDARTPYQTLLDPAPADPSVGHGNTSVAT